MKALQIVNHEPAQVMTVEEFGENLIEAFVATRSANVNTASKYRRILKQFTAWLTREGFTACEAAVGNYFAKLREENKSDYTLRLYSTVIKAFFAYLGRKGICENVGAEVRLDIHKQKTHAKKALTHEQAQKLIGTVKGKDIISLRDRAIIALALTTGVRTIEIERATVGNFNPANGYYTLEVQGKGRHTADATVKVAPWVADMIKAYLNKRPNITPQSPLFASAARNRMKYGKYGETLSAQSVGKMIKRRMKEIGINDAHITAHSTRHFAATCAIKAGVDLREVSAMLRHSNINVTMTYLHDIELDSRRAELTVADSLSSAACVL